ncbi:hypothetical protein NEOLEDRAFT_89557 [Neolentinus lepideus HHB14362 ss-1]|uniref:Uncharacterized protein n=1 Tax=Neolentinus lepideus HHB14362 ss-1 TaxID=1314782 RepID=A0A165MW38_9AGAM|nr:hypothetical protein NEOLEDRAFT_89557 [Neolentinus lepideus HHB14362 ss-1]
MIFDRMGTQLNWFRVSSGVFSSKAPRRIYPTNHSASLSPPLRRVETHLRYSPTRPHAHEWPLSFPRPASACPTVPRKSINLDCMFGATRDQTWPFLEVGISHLYARASFTEIVYYTPWVEPHIRLGWNNLWSYLRRYAMSQLCLERQILFFF